MLHDIFLKQEDRLVAGKASSILSSFFVRLYIIDFLFIDSQPGGFIFTIHHFQEVRYGFMRLAEKVAITQKTVHARFVDHISHGPLSAGDKRIYITFLKVAAHCFLLLYSLSV